jgi:hypothetical protein
MGKTSALHVARTRVEEEGGAVVFADLSTASSAADMANRILESTTRALGRRWRDLASDMVARLRVRIQLVPDPVSGLAIPTVEAGLRSRDAVEQVDTLIGVLDALEGMATARETEVGVVLDEFQEIHRFGGEAAEWRLRGAVQGHQRIAYVLAGSDASLIRQMIGPNRAFYELFEVLPFGAIEAAHLSRWIDERMDGAGAAADGLGARVVSLAGDRTRDVVRLARAAFEERRAGTEGVDALVRAGLLRVVAEEDDRMRTTWDGLTDLQQNVLRAVAWGRAGLAAADTLETFAIGHGGTARNSALALAKRGLLRRADTTTGFVFESPFAKAWVVLHALPDVGILFPVDDEGG